MGKAKVSGDRHVLNVIASERGRSTLTLPIRNPAIAYLQEQGLITISAPRPHKHYQIVDLELTEAGREELARMEATHG